MSRARDDGFFEFLTRKGERKAGTVEARKMIGIVGGVGPYAGLDLNQKVFGQTLASRDQDHLRVVLVSWSDLIPDRTEFLLGREKKNPGVAIAEAVATLEAAGAGVIGIPCNTAHSPLIFRAITEACRKKGCRASVLHMIKEVARFLKCEYPEVGKIGVLGTNGTVSTDIYGTTLEPEGFEVVYPSSETQTQKVHSAIYDESFGIKAWPSPVTETARKKIREAMQELVEAGSDAIVLACTELPLAMPKKDFACRPVIDATLVLARALVREAAPDKLKQLDVWRPAPLGKELTRFLEKPSVLITEEEQIRARESQLYASVRIA